ncbi:MAG: DegT/DnrJ/EryC1/StrS family aminotransferase [Gemmatimonadales bacterium]
MRDIPFFNYRKAFADQRDAFTATFHDVLARGAYILQRDMLDFEMHLGAYVGASHALGVGNATDGLHFLWRAAGLRPGDEVILPSHTMVATAAAIHFAGGVPVPVDCGPDHLLDPAAAAAAVGPRTRGICPVQLNGRACDMGAIEALARKHDLILIEDAAQALGAMWKGRMAGSFGKGGAFSFYPAKLLGCLGDGGAVTTNDADVAREVFLLRDHGRTPEGDVVGWGLNSRLDNLQAAFLDLQLSDYAKIIGTRRRLAGIYHEMLRDISALRLPPGPDADPDHFDVYQNYELEADRRDELRAHLKARGIGTNVQWGGKAVHQFAALGFAVHLPETERFFTRALMLPLNTTLSDDDARTVAETIRDFYGR